MKVTLIYPDIFPDFLSWPGGFYVGIGSLSAVLKEAGHKISLIHMTQPMGKSDFIERIEREAPDLIGFSTTSHMFSYVKQMAGWLKEANPGIPTICGGIHPTIAPEESLGADGINMICRGEGEAPLLELCQKMEQGEAPDGILNLWIKSGEEFIRNPLRPLMADLDKLPFPDRSCFSYLSLLDEREGKGVFLASRGCPYNCTYCCNHLLRKIYAGKGKAVRFRSVDNLITEIEQVLSNYPSLNCCYFHDDILFLNRQWADEFAESYTKRIGIPYICNDRADVTDQKTVDLFKKSGCIYVKFGLESGNEEIRTKVLNRHMTNEQIETAFSLCKKAGLGIISFNMVGVPFETPSAILDTIKLNAKVDVNLMQVSIFHPYEGTALAEICKKESFTGVKEFGPSFYSGFVLNQNTVSYAQVLMFKNYFISLVRYYQIQMKLPERLSVLLTRVSDRLLCLPATARILNLIHRPINYFNTNLLFWKFRLKQTLRQLSSRGSAG